MSLRQKLPAPFRVVRTVAGGIVVPGTFEEAPVCGDHFQAGRHSAAWVVELAPRDPDDVLDTALEFRNAGRCSRCDVHAVERDVAEEARTIFPQKRFDRTVDAVELASDSVGDHLAEKRLFHFAVTEAGAFFDRTNAFEVNLSTFDAWTLDGFVAAKQLLHQFRHTRLDDDVFLLRFEDDFVVDVVSAEVQERLTARNDLAFVNDPHLSGSAADVDDQDALVAHDVEACPHRCCDGLRHEPNFGRTERRRRLDHELAMISVFLGLRDAEHEAQGWSLERDSVPSTTYSAGAMFLEHQLFHHVSEVGLNAFSRLIARDGQAGTEEPIEFAFVAFFDAAAVEAERRAAEDVFVAVFCGNRMVEVEDRGHVSIFVESAATRGIGAHVEEDSQDGSGVRIFSQEFDFEGFGVIKCTVNDNVGR